MIRVEPILNNLQCYCACRTGGGKIVLKRLEDIANDNSSNYCFLVREKILLDAFSSGGV